MSIQFGLALAFALLLMFVVPVLLIRLVVRHRQVPVAVPLMAVLFYLINLGVNIPLTGFVWPWVFGRTSLLTLVLTCVTWGVCEELARYASFRFVPVMKRHRDESGALAAGLGHGAAESVFFGLRLVVGVVTVFVLPSRFQADAAQQTLTQGPLALVVTGLDRLPALAINVALALVIVLALRRTHWFLPVAIVAHTLVDFVVFGTQKYVPGLFYEAVFALFGGVALILVALMVRNRSLPPEENVEEPWAQRLRRDPGESAPAQR